MTYFKTVSGCGFLLLNKIYQLSRLIRAQIYKDLQMLFGQVECGHFGIGLTDVFMGLGQIRFQVYRLFTCSNCTVKLSLLAVAES